MNFVHYKTTIMLKKTPTAKRGRKQMFLFIAHPYYSAPPRARYLFYYPISITRIKKPLESLVSRGFLGTRNYSNSMVAGGLVV